MRRLAAPDRALLVGIDRYAPAGKPGGPAWPSLAGAVRDLRGLESLLGRLGVPAARIERLYSPLEEPPPPRNFLPTYENLIAALQRLALEARPGEQVLVFYAGHGGRATTAFPELKGEAGIDEVLVPCNFGEAGARCLRDVELAALVHRMVEHGISLTLVLDCCHAGGALRKAGEEPVPSRGLGLLGSPALSLPSLAGSREELVAAWRRHTDPDMPAPSGWLPAPRGYVLLAACEEHEKALEYAFDGDHREGVLSHALLEALAPRSRLSYRDLYDRVLSTVHSAFPAQTPQLEGDDERYVFEAVRETRLRGVPVLRIDPAGGRVLLRTGEAQGVLPGTRFVVDPGLPVEVFRSGASLSWARMEGELPTSGVQPGAQAHLTALPAPLRVRVLGPAAEAIAAVLLRETRGFAVPAGPEAEPDLCLAEDGRGRIELRDGRGGRLPNQGRPLSIGEPGGTERLREHLVHLARFRAVQGLSGPPESAPLSGRLQARFWHWNGERGRGDELIPRPPDLDVLVHAGESLDFEICNSTRQPLHLTILHLRPDWSIVQAYPPPSLGRAGLPLEPERPLGWTLHRRLRPGLEAGREEVLIFATVRPAELRWLQLPPLDPRARAGSGLVPTDAPPLPLRALEPEAVADRGWTLRRLRLRAPCEQSSALRVGTE